MKIACNYYAETEKLFDEGKIELDYFKYPGLGFQMAGDIRDFEALCARVAAKRPILLHGLYTVSEGLTSYDLSSPALRADFDEAAAGRLIEMTKTPGLSFHPTQKAYDPALPLAEALEIIITNARFIREKYAALDFVSLENCDAKKFGPLLLPEAVCSYVRESGCGFILDISHAYVVSKGLGRDFYDYIRALPLERTTEIHINGWVEKGSDIMCHTEIHEEGYRALEFALGLCSPRIVTVEYGRHNDRIGSGAPVLRPDVINAQAMDEIARQLEKVRALMERLRV